MLDKRKIIAVALSVIFMIPNFIGLSHIFSHHHKHEICKAVGEKHFHKLAKKCCNSTAYKNTSGFVDIIHFKIFDTVSFKKITVIKADKNNIVFIKSRTSRAPPTIFLS